MSFLIKKFSECDLNDPFFDSLKGDYNGFETWFEKKSKNGETAFVHKDQHGIQAFLYIKDSETEAVGDLPAEPRIKIGTLKINPASEGQRLGEGAIGLALWKWQKSDLNQIYVTVYPKHEDLINILKTYGFEFCTKKGEEDVYMKDKRTVKYDTVRRSFPYFNPDFARGKYIPINENFHDPMFQYSDLKNTAQTVGEMSVSNGITKNYIAAPTSRIDYRPGDLIFIYRKHMGTGSKAYKSVITSYCTVSKITWVKKNWNKLLSFDAYMILVGNKSVYDPETLKNEYKKPDLCVIELIYNGYFGAGHNITYSALQEIGLFEGHPYTIELNRADIIKIIEMGGKNEQDLIVNKS